MTLILNMLLILLLVVLTGLYIQGRKQPGNRSISRRMLIPGLFFILIAGFRFLNLKVNQAAPEASSLSSVQSMAYSSAFTQSIEKIFSGYFRLAEQLAAGKGIEAEVQAGELKQALDSFNIEEIVIDTLKYDALYLSLDNARAETSSIIADPELAEKRASFNILSREMVSILTLLSINEPPYYRLICPDAFGKDREGWWIGKTAEALNPYGISGCSQAKQISKPEQPIIK